MNIHANAIAVWKNDSWHRLGGDVYGHINALITYGDYVVAGGNFYVVGTDSIRGLAAWDGNKWAGLGSGLKRVTGDLYGPIVSDLGLYHDALIAVGKFDSAGGLPTKNVALWNGQNWSPMGDGLGGDGHYDLVNCVTIFGNQIIAGGAFSFSGDSNISCIAVWNGERWTTLGSGVARIPYGFGVLDMTMFDNKLIAGGYFDSAGGQPASNIASWDGTDWSPLGSGVSNPFESWPDWMLHGWVYSLCAYQNKLYVGGVFSQAGHKVSLNVAAWTKDTPTDTPDEDHTVLPTSTGVSQNYPNPFNPSTTIEYSLEHRDHVTIDIFNMLGEHVRNIIDETKPAGRYQIQWNGTNQLGRQVGTGVYFYKVRIGEQEASKKMLLLK